MMFYGGRQLASSFRTVRANTIQLAEDIPEPKYAFKAAPDTRSIAEILVHIAVGPTFQAHVHGNKVTDLKTVNFGELMQKLGAAEAKPRNKAEIIAFLKEEGERFATFLEGLDDSFLSEPVAMPPGAQPSAKSRFEMLLSPKEHEMHHRGQLMLLQRMIGITPHLTRQRMAQAHAAAPAQAQR
jgi:uncharacterized damage-inducible protein DinB